MCTTFPDSSPWRKFLADSRINFALCLLVFFSCVAKETISPAGKHQKAGISNKFEWAIQYYEAGAYKEALKNFQKLRNKGTEVSGFDLIPFYVGMSEFHLGQFEGAAQELEAFLRENTQRQENQDARISLLLTYEKLARWQNVSSLAAETDKLTLFQNNRALLKLIWARALREQGEILGAKAVLHDSTPYLDKIGADDRPPLYSEPDQDLWGRYHFISTLIEETECNKSSPMEAKAKKKLYAPWLESVTDCFRNAIQSASSELFSRESPWSAMAGESLSRGIASFAKKVDASLQQEKSSLNHYRALQKNSREQFYRLLSTVDENLKIFKDRGVAPAPLEPLRKQIENLLVSISRPS